MKIDHFINELNKLVDELSFTEARRLIELNLSALSSPSIRRKLNTNASELLRFIINENQKKGDNKSLTRADLLVINHINSCSTNFDISELKRTLKDKFEFLQRADVQEYLNSDAKALLSGMGIICKIK